MWSETNIRCRIEMTKKKKKKNLNEKQKIIITRTRNSNNSRRLPTYNYDVRCYSVGRSQEQSEPGPAFVRHTAVQMAQHDRRPRAAGPPGLVRRRSVPEGQTIRDRHSAGRRRARPKTRVRMARANISNVISDTRISTTRRITRQ